MMSCMQIYRHPFEKSRDYNSSARRLCKLTAALEDRTILYLVKYVEVEALSQSIASKSHQQPSPPPVASHPIPKRTSVSWHNSSQVQNICKSGDLDGFPFFVRRRDKNCFPMLLVHLNCVVLQVSIAITEQKLLHIDLSANSDSAIFGGPVGALAFEQSLFFTLYFEV
jgi:hypothetical protein